MGAERSRPIDRQLSRQEVVNSLRLPCSFAPIETCFVVLGLDSSLQQPIKRCDPAQLLPELVSKSRKHHESLHP